MNVGVLGLPLITINEHPSPDDYSLRLHLLYSRLARETPTGQAISNRLNQDSRFIALKGKMLGSGQGGSRIENENLFAAWWLWRANTVGQEQADQELNNFLFDDKIEVMSALWVYGVDPKKSLVLTRGISIIPLREMPDSSDKEQFLKTNVNFSKHSSLAPTAALIKRFKTPKIVPNLTLDGPEPGFFEATKAGAIIHQELDETAILLNCISGFCCLPGYKTSYKPEEVPLGPFRESGGGIPALEIVPHRVLEASSVDESKISTVVEGFHRLSEPARQRIVRALRRLAHAKARLDYGDKALDLGIALEMLLLNSEHQNQDLPGQLSLHFRLRGSWLIGEDTKERVKLYKMLGKIYSLRSQLAHNGMSSELMNMQHDEREKFLGEHISVAERIIQHIIIHGTPDDWSAVLLGGS